MSFKEFSQTDVNQMIENMQKGMSQEQFEDFIKNYGGGSVESYREQLMRSMNDEKTKTSMLRWYGSKEKVIEGQKAVPGMDALRKELEAVQRQFAVPKEPSGMEEHLLVSKLAELYKKMLNLGNARAILIDLADEYLNNSRLAEAQDKQFGAGTAQYMAEAIKRYYGV